MTRYMLDTDIISELIKNPTARQRSALRIGEDNVCTSIIVAGEKPK